MSDPLTSREDADHWFGDPREEGSEHPDAYEPDDPKHPTFHERMADRADAERKQQKEQGA